MDARILPADPSREYWFHEGCHILELLNDGDDEAVSIARARVAPGGVTRWHALRDTGERYLVLTGSGLVEAGNAPPQRVTAMDVVVIPPGCRQRIRNDGNDELVFLAICTPRFRPDAYIDLENG